MKSSDYQTMEGILYTDEYQLTMAQLYYRYALHEKQGLFEHFYRSNPNYGAHQAGFCINAGLEWLLDWMGGARFRQEDIDYLRAQKDSTGKRLFADDFLGWLLENGNMEAITLRAIPEGRVVHPGTPLTVVQGPLAMAQILETPLLNYLNYQILIATKAQRMHEAGRGRLLLEFGLRRAQERGANAGTRAALIGGADFSSNVGASTVLGFQAKGTHAHSMVQLFIALGMDELAAFRAYADVYPDDCLLLVDTVDSLHSGIPNAIRVFEELKRKGHRPVGIRLDSGDLAYLSIEAAKMLNAAGFEDVSIVLSNEMDELVIWQILTQITQEAPRNGLDADKLIGRLVFGVGTRLITSWGDPALGGVYKLVAVCEKDEWVPAIKLSESPEKVPNPGHKQAWRIYDTRGHATADLITMAHQDPRGWDRVALQHPSDSNKHRVLDRRDISEIEPLLVDVLSGGRKVLADRTIGEMREQRDRDVQRLDAGVRRLVNPHIYHVSLSTDLWNLKQRLISQALGKRPWDRATEERG